MAKHLRKEIDNLKKKILFLSATVEESVRKSVHSVQQRDVQLAEDVIANDSVIDDMEVNVEEECLKVLALYQPVAIDLRLIVSMLKINNDLERIGDLSVNIAKRAELLSNKNRVNVFLVPKMAEKAQAMLKKSLDALVNLDSDLAREVCSDDDEIDAVNREIYDMIKEAIRCHPENADRLIHFLTIARHLERIADHATNIAEDVIYMIEGEIIRHKHFI